MWSYSTSSNKNRNTTLTSKRHMNCFSSMLLVSSLTVIQSNRKEQIRNAYQSRIWEYLGRSDEGAESSLLQRSHPVVTYFVAGHILSTSPATTDVNVHDRYCRRQQYMSTFTVHIFAGNNICQRSRHIFSPATNICQRSRHQYMSTFAAHIFAGNNIRQGSRHIFSPATMYAWFYGTDCRPSAHIVARDDICRNSCVVCVCWGVGGDRKTNRQGRFSTIVFLTIR